MPSAARISRIAFYSVLGLSVSCLLVAAIVTYERFGTQTPSSSAAVSQTDPLKILPDPVATTSEVKAIEVGVDDWPWWQGPSRNNHASDSQAIDIDHVVWVQDLPGLGHSSPVVFGDQLFLTSANEEAHSQSLISLDSTTGVIKWQSVLHQAGLVHKNSKNSHASSTVAVDGEKVFTLFLNHDAIWLSAVDLAGRLLWQTEVGPFISKEGFGASPLVHDSFVFVGADNVGQSWLAAVHRNTGKIVWRVSRPGAYSYASPCLISVDGESQVVMVGHKRIVAYAPSDGSECWSIDGPTYSVSTPAFANGHIFYTSSTQEDGIGAVSLLDAIPKRLWQHHIKAETPSPLFDGELVYFVQDIGVVLCVEPASGEILWRKRVGGNYSSSPILVGQNIVIGDEDGKLTMLKAGRTFEIVRTRSLEGGILATPASVCGRLYVRTTTQLYCLGRGEES